MRELGLRGSESGLEFISIHDTSVSTNKGVWCLHEKSAVYFSRKSPGQTNPCVSVSVTYIKLALLTPATRDLTGPVNSQTALDDQSSEVDTVGSCSSSTIPLQRASCSSSPVPLQRAVVPRDILSTATKHKDAHVNQWPRGPCPSRHGHVLRLWMSSLPWFLAGCFYILAMALPA